MVHHKNQQLDFIPGAIGRISVRGTTKTKGCKFIMVDMSKNLTCCFSATSRGVSLCHPDTQSDGCRKKDRCECTFFVIIISSFIFFTAFLIPRFTVEELPGSCLLSLPDLDKNDAGPYKVIFPSKLRDNIKFRLAQRSESTSSNHNYAIRKLRSHTKIQNTKYISFKRFKKDISNHNKL